MKFWKGNRVDGEFEMPVEEVAERFFAAGAHQTEKAAAWPLDRTLRDWLTSKDGLDAVWDDERAYAELFGYIHAHRAGLVKKPVTGARPADVL